MNIPLSFILPFVKGKVAGLFLLKEVRDSNFNFLFFKVWKGFFLSRIFSNTFFGPILAIIKRRKNCQFLTKLWKSPKFSTFLTSCFYSLERLFFF